MEWGEQVKGHQLYKIVEATSLLTKNITCVERNKGIKKNALNHSHRKKSSADPKARFGCKEKSKF